MTDKRCVKMRRATVLAAIGRFDGVLARDLADALEIPDGDKLGRNALTAHFALQYKPTTSEDDQRYDPATDRMVPS